MVSSDSVRGGCTVLLCEKRLPTAIARSLRSQTIPTEILIFPQPWRRWRLRARPFPSRAISLRYRTGGVFNAGA